MNDKPRNAGADVATGMDNGLMAKSERFDLYDQHILEKSEVELLYGDWEKLASLSEKIIENSSHGAELTLRKAAGLFQLGRAEEARYHVAHAEELGVGKRRVKQVIISGAYNSLGLAAAIAKREDVMQSLFGSAIEAVVGYENPQLLTKGRMMRQLEELESDRFFRVNRTEIPDSVDQLEQAKGPREQLLSDEATIAAIVECILPDIYLQVGNASLRVLSEIPCKVICLSPRSDNESASVNILVINETVDHFCGLSAWEHLERSPNLVTTFTKPLVELIVRDILEIAKIADQKTVMLIPSIYFKAVDNANESRVDATWETDLWKLPDLLRKHFPALRLQEFDTSESGMLVLNGLSSYKGGVDSEMLESLFREAQSMTTPHSDVIQRRRAVRFSEKHLKPFNEEAAEAWQV